jgi:3-hydroxyacyl-CoA dehydrogenase/enoyl-CoA hydratase/3-hydroxybutyryl-CoA epimerase
MSLLVEGNNPIDIESAGKAAGFPVGPLAVIDEISIQLLADIRDQSIKDLSTETVSKSDDLWDEVIDFMLDDAKRPGKAHGKGFYEYPKNTEKFIWPGITKRFHSPQKPISQKEMVERFYFSQSIEAVRCFEEKVIESEMDANIGSIHGWGFPLFTGGVIQYINNYGLKKFHDKANQLSNMYGKRFSSPQLLDSMIKNGEKSFK